MANTNIEFLKEHIRQLKEVLFDDNVPKHIIESVEYELSYWQPVLNDLLELQAIKEAKPSEALEMLEGIVYVADVLKVNHKIGSRDCANQEIKEMVDRLNYRIPIIKATLLKAQEQEEIMPILIEILKGCKMRYEDTFEPNMRLYMSKDICEKIDKFLEMIKNGN